MFCKLHVANVLRRFHSLALWDQAGGPLLVHGTRKCIIITSRLTIANQCTFNNANQAPAKQQPTTHHYRRLTERRTCSSNLKKNPIVCTGFLCCYTGVLLESLIIHHIIITSIRSTYYTLSNPFRRLYKVAREMAIETDFA